MNDEWIRWVDRQRRIADWALPPVVIRCACGQVVHRYDGEHRKMRLEQEFTCTKHGPLERLTLGDAFDEWTRLGEPRELKLKRKPIQ